MDIDHLRDDRVLSAHVADVGVTREHSRRRRLLPLLVVIGAIARLDVGISAGRPSGRLPAPDHGREPRPCPLSASCCWWRRSW